MVKRYDIKLIYQTAAINHRVEETEYGIYTHFSDYEKLETEKDAFITALHNERVNFKQEEKIINRIWEIFGNPSYEELEGKSLYDLIEQSLAENGYLKAKLVEAESKLIAVRDSMIAEVNKFKIEHEAHKAELTRLKEAKISAKLPLDCTTEFNSMQEELDYLCRRIEWICDATNRDPAEYLNIPDDDDESR